MTGQNVCPIECHPVFISLLKTIIKEVTVGPTSARVDLVCMGSLDVHPRVTGAENSDGTRWEFRAV